MPLQTITDHMAKIRGQHAQTVDGDELGLYFSTARRGARRMQSLVANVLGIPAWASAALRLPVI